MLGTSQIPFLCADSRARIKRPFSPFLDRVSGRRSQLQPEEFQWPTLCFIVRWPDETGAPSTRGARRFLQAASCRLSLFASARRYAFLGIHHADCINNRPGHSDVDLDCSKLRLGPLPGRMPALAGIHALRDAVRIRTRSGSAHTIGLQLDGDPWWREHRARFRAMVRSQNSTRLLQSRDQIRTSDRQDPGRLKRA